MLAAEQGDWLLEWGCKIFYSRLAGTTSRKSGNGTVTDTVGWVAFSAVKIIIRPSANIHSYKMT